MFFFLSQKAQIFLMSKEFGIATPHSAPLDHRT